MVPQSPAFRRGEEVKFSLFQHATAERIGVAPESVVAAQAAGGAAGNMITVHNVVAASAVVGLVGREGDVLRQTVLPLTYYLLVSGSLAYVLVNGVALNPGTVLLALTLVALAALLAWLRHRDARLPVPEHARLPRPDRDRGRAE